MDFMLEDSLGFLLSRTDMRLKNELMRRFREYDITTEQWSVLNFLWKHEGITPKELADKSFKDKPNTNRILEKLQAKAFIVRKPHPTDNRAFQIFVTERGWALRDELIPIAQQLLDEGTKGINKDQVEQLKGLLNQIYKNLNEGESEV